MFLAGHYLRSLTLHQIAWCLGVRLLRGKLGFILTVWPGTSELTLLTYNSLICKGRIKMCLPQRLRWNEVLYGKCLLSQCLEHYKFFRVAAVLETEKINKKLRAKTQFCMASFLLLSWFQGYWNVAFTGNRAEPNLKSYVRVFCVFLSSGSKKNVLLPWDSLSFRNRKIQMRRLLAYAGWQLE